MFNASQILEYQNFITDIRSKIRDLEREPCTALRNVLGRYLQVILERALTRLEQLREEEGRGRGMCRNQILSSSSSLPNENSNLYPTS